MLPLFENGVFSLFRILLQGRFLLSPICVLIQSHIISLWTLEYLFYTLGYKPVLFYFVTQVVPGLAMELFQLALSLDIPLSVQMVLFCLFLFFSMSLFSGTRRCSRIILYIFCTSPRISHFLNEHWFLLLENNTRNQDPGSRCAYYCWWAGSPCL